MANFCPILGLARGPKKGKFWAKPRIFSPLVWRRQARFYTTGGAGHVGKRVNYITPRPRPSAETSACIIPTHPWKMKKGLRPFPFFPWMMLSLFRMLNRGEQNIKKLLKGKDYQTKTSDESIYCSACNNEFKITKKSPVSCVESHEKSNRHQHGAAKWEKREEKRQMALSEQLENVPNEFNRDLTVSYRVQYFHFRASGKVYARFHQEMVQERLSR